MTGHDFRFSEMGLFRTAVRFSRVRHACYPPPPPRERAPKVASLLTSPARSRSSSLMQRSPYPPVFVEKTKIFCFVFINNPGIRRSEHRDGGGAGEAGQQERGQRPSDIRAEPGGRRRNESGALCRKARQRVNGFLPRCLSFCATSGILFRLPRHERRYEGLPAPEDYGDGGRGYGLEKREA